jgi:hypothetical protein
MSFSSERQSPQHAFRPSAEVLKATQVEIDRLHKLQIEGRLSISGAELLGALERDCLVHDF